MFRRLLHLIGLHTRSELVTLSESADRYIDAAEHSIAELEAHSLHNFQRALLYAASLVHNPVDEPHLVDDSDLVIRDAEHWLNEWIGTSSGQWLPEAQRILLELERAGGDGDLDLMAEIEQQQDGHIAVDIESDAFVERLKQELASKRLVWL